ncbi:MAG: hypothetical protein SOH48_03075 [Eubacteriales bacterium]|jgi:endoglucanase
MKKAIALISFVLLSISTLTLPASNEQYRCYFYQYICKAVKSIGGVPCCWDNGWTGKYGFALFDRTTNQVTHQDLINAILAGVS